eukprot:2530204-Rhodomonas_salina.1
MDRDPVPALFARQVILMVATSKDTIELMVPVVDPAVTVSLALPCAIVRGRARRDVSDIQDVLSQAESPRRTCMLYLIVPNPRPPLTSTATEFPPGVFPLSTLLTCGRSRVKLSLTDATRTPAVTETKYEREYPCVEPAMIDESESHAVASAALAPCLACAENRGPSIPAPRTVTLIEPVVAAFPLN